MPYQVQQLLVGRGDPVCVTKDDPVSQALSLMIEHDYSQLPVVKREDDYVLPEGMVTYESILRGIRNFNARIQDLRVRDVTVASPVYSMEDDLFDILDRLKDTNAVLIDSGAGGPGLIGIVTSYDTAEYFRKRTEDLMRVEDIELMIKDFILAAYTENGDRLNEEKLARAIGRVVPSAEKQGGEAARVKGFAELTMADYISLLLMPDTWSFFQPIFSIQKDSLRELLNGVRLIRNALAHFRTDITAEERDRLKFGAEWLSRCQEEFQARKEEQKRQIIDPHGDLKPEPTIIQVGESLQVQVGDEVKLSDFSMTDSVISGSRYAALADWLQSQPGKIDRVTLTFDEIEQIIEGDLPASARQHRAWWANDAVGHNHSQLWLDAGWRTVGINFSQGLVTFARIQEREQAYIRFFSKLISELRKQTDFPLKEISPDGVSWVVVQNLPRNAPVGASLAFSFTRDRLLRVELYLDLGDQQKNKAVFDRLHEQKAGFEARLGALDWQRLDHRRASRIAALHQGSIMETRNHAELRKWAAETMAKFFDVLLEPAEKAILEIRDQ